MSEHAPLQPRAVHVLTLLHISRDTRWWLASSQPPMSQGRGAPSSVLPVPGSPSSRMPLGGLPPSTWNFFGLRRNCAATHALRARACVRKRLHLYHGSAYAELNLLLLCYIRGVQYSEALNSNRHHQHLLCIPQWASTAHQEKEVPCAGCKYHNGVSRWSRHKTKMTAA